MIKKVFVAGNVTWNTMVDVEAFPEARPQTIFGRGSWDAVGGSGAGKALNLNKLEVDVTLHAHVGDDEWGAKIRKAMTAAQVDHLFDIEPTGTMRHVNLMRPDGERISIFLQLPPQHPPFSRVQVESLIAAADYVVLNLPNYCRALIPIAQKHNKPIWIDIHNYDGKNPYHTDFLDAAAVIQMSSSNLPNYRLFMEKWVAQGKQLVVCTHGQDGVTALTQAGDWIECAALPVTAVDSNGAGDGFFAALLWAHSAGFAAEKCVRMGTIGGALAVTAPTLAPADNSSAQLLSIYRQQFDDLI